ncbi:MAG TPA: caspase family protein [Pyrinomonadaceae bacterium]|nr:caspase family protein [Pyrinomonadaceae bacterium]
MKNIVLLVCCLALSLTPATSHSQEQRKLSLTSAPAEQRVALVIGNSAYTAAPLKNPVNDARDIAQILRDLGFDVIHREDLNQTDMKKAIRAFGEKIKNGGVGLFYYAGHGVQVKGVNYLVPVDAKIESEEEVEYESVDAGFVLAQMESARNRMNIMILDACRNNPFARSFRSGSRGLAQMDAPSGTLIAYSTAPGSVASDGTERNGLYTQEFLKNLRTPGLGLEDVFKRVRVSVRSLTQGKQTPWESSSLTGDFYFVRGDATGGPSNPAAVELAYWDSIKNSADPSDFQSYLAKYPEGMFVDIAKRRAQPPANASPLPTVEQLLENYFRAMGGKDVMKQISTIEQKGTFEVVQDKRKAEGEIEMYQKRPGKLLTVQKVGRLVIKEVFDGTNGWLYSSNGGTKPVTAQQLELQQRLAGWADADVEKIKQHYTKITVKGREKVGERDVVVLEATLQNGRADRMYFDAGTELIYRMDVVTDSVTVQQGVALAMQVYLEDYVEVNGVKIPMTVRQVQDGGTTITAKFAVTKLRFNIPLDDKLFGKPSK